MPYLAVTVRVSKQIAIQCKEITQKFGWQLADLLRTLICIGAVFAFLEHKSLEREKAASTLLGGLKLARPSGGLSRQFSERPYAFRIQGRKSTLLTLSLPESLCDLIALYANQMEASRNETYYKFLQHGLLIYLKAQTSLLEATH